MAGPPNILLLGYGVFDSLQITVEAQQLLTRYGSAYSIGLPPNLARYLAAQRVKVTDLGSRLAPGRPFADAYLDIANFLLERTASELPVVLLTPGNPLGTNAIGRFLAMEAPRLGLTVQVVPALSQIDVILSAIGLDISTFGLQLFDATKLVDRGHAINPRVPLIVLHAGGFALGEVPNGNGEADLTALAVRLGEFYPPGHAVLVLTVCVSPPGLTTAPATIASLAEPPRAVGPGASLFVDALRD